MVGLDNLDLTEELVCATLALKCLMAKASVGRSYAGNRMPEMGRAPVEPPDGFTSLATLRG